MSGVYFDILNTYCNNIFRHLKNDSSNAAEGDGPSPRLKVDGGGYERKTHPDRSENVHGG